MNRLTISRSIISRSNRTFFLIAILLVLSTTLPAQDKSVLTNSATIQIAANAILPDAGYSFERIRADTSLKFGVDILNASVSDHYWVRINIQNPYPNNENYRLSLSHPLNYTAYWYNGNKNVWQRANGGLNVPESRREVGVTPITFNKSTNNTIYLKVDLRDVKPYNYANNLTVKLEQDLAFTTREEIVSTAFIICCIVLVSFSFYNLYLYFNLRDKAYLYYVIVQLGAIIYFTANKLFINVLLPIRIYNIKVIDGKMVPFTFNNFFEHIGVTILFCGFILFTRAYLNTKNLLPTYDKVLKVICYVYFFIEVVPISITITGIYYLNPYLLANIFILLIILTCIATGNAAYRHGQTMARYYLAAYMLPLVFAAGASIYVLMHKTSSHFLPELALVTQIFTFAVALVARVKLINDDLKQKAIEGVQLEADLTVADYKRLLIEEENKNISLLIALEKENNDLLQQKLDANQRELVGNSLYIHQKNKLLADVKAQISDMGTLNNDALLNIQSSLNQGMHLDEEWNKFKLHFEQVHPSFFDDLQKAHPSLTKYELRLFAYFHINLSTKEIASLLNIVPASVRQAKARLNKKMNS